MNCNDLGSVLVCGVPGGPNIPRVPDGNYGVWDIFVSFLGEDVGILGLSDLGFKQFW